MVPSILQDTFNCLLTSIKMVFNFYGKDVIDSSRLLFGHLLQSALCNATCVPILPHRL